MFATSIHKHLIVAVSLLSASCANATIEEPLSPSNVAAINNVFSDIKSDGPGCVLSIMKDGSMLYQNGYGLANIEHNIPITPDTVFRIASTSKQFTAMSTIILAEEGKISLDDDIRKYLPEMPDYGKPITIQNLINHTSGIRDFLTLFFLKGYKDQDYYTESELFKMLARQKNLDFMPGEKMSYSNSGYVLQSIIIERVTGKTLAQYAKEKIFDPLGMKNTHFHNDGTRLIMNRAYGYNPDHKNGGYKVGGTPQELIGDGGIFTTVGDLALYDNDFYEGKVWKPNVKKNMVTPGLQNDGKPATYFPNVYYAGGLIIGDKRGVPYMRHAGQFAGFLTDFIRYPDHKLSVAVLCNGGNLGAPGYTGKISDIFLESHYTEPESLDEDEAAANIEYKAISKETLNAIAGTYYNEDLDVNYEIVRKGDTVELLVGHRPTRISFEDLQMPIFDLGDNIIGNQYIKITIVKDDQQNVTALNFTDFSVVKNLYFNRINK